MSQADEITTHELRRFWPLAAKAICNGAGPKGLGWLVPDLAFCAAADRHDLDYWRGGGIRQKAEADFRFFVNCTVAGWRKGGWRSWVLAFIAPVYFVAVVLLGWGSFHFGKRRGRAELERVEMTMACINWEEDE